MTRYGFKGADSNQTLALEAERRRRGRRVLWLAMIVAALVLFALAGLLVVLKTSAKKSAATSVEELPGAKLETPMSAPVPATSTSAPTQSPTPTPEPAQASPPPPAAVAPTSAPEPAAPAVDANPSPASETKPATASTPVNGQRVKPPVAELVRIVKSQNWPTGADDCLQLADDLNDYGRTAEANAAYSQALTLAGSNQEPRIRALGGLAVTFEKMGMREEARNAVDQLLVLQPNNRFAKSLKARLSR